MKGATVPHHVDTYNLEVDVGDRQFRPTLRVQDDGLWTLDDDGLREYVGEASYNDWLVDLWTRVYTKQTQNVWYRDAKTI